MAITDKLTAIANAIRTQSGKTAKLSLDQMPTEIINLNALNFEVVGGTSAPSNPKENTIWVNTDTEITGWDFGVGDMPARLDISNAVKATNVVSGVSNGAISFKGDLSPVWSNSYIAKARMIAGVTYVFSMNLGYGRMGIYSDATGNERLNFVEGINSDSVINDDIHSVELTLTRTTDVYLHFCTDIPGENGKPAFTTPISFYPKGVNTWIQTGISSPVEFNALKKNGIQVYPLSAKQYIGGAWVSKTAKSYQGGAWREWIPAGALYYNGDQCVGTSGGWNARGWVYGGSITNTIVPSVAFNADHMQITLGSGNLVSGAVEVVKDQDLTNVSKLTIDFEATTYAYQVKLLVIPRSTSYMDEAVCAVDLQASGDQQTIARRTVSLDVSSVSGSYDVVIAFVNAWSGGCNATMKVYSVLKE